MTDLRVPDLTFPAIRYGDNETPWDLLPLLYCGGAGSHIRKASTLIASRHLGSPLMDRIPMLEKLHEELSGKVAGGGCEATVKGEIYHLRKLYAWGDAAGCRLTLASAAADFIAYTEYLLHRVRIVGNLSEDGAYSYALSLSCLLSNVLELKLALLSKTRLVKPKRRKRVLGTQADKQNLESNFVFGYALLDITQALTAEAIRGPLPVTINLRSGKNLTEWCRLLPSSQVKALMDENTWPRRREQAMKRRAASCSNRARHPLT